MMTFEVRRPRSRKKVRPRYFKTTAAEKSSSVTNPPTVKDDNYRHPVDIGNRSIPASPEPFDLEKFDHTVDIINTDKLLPKKIRGPNGRKVRIEYNSASLVKYMEGVYPDGAPDCERVGKKSDGMFYIPADSSDNRWLFSWRIVPEGELFYYSCDSEDELRKDTSAKPSEAELPPTRTPTPFLDSDDYDDYD